MAVSSAPDPRTAQLDGLRSVLYAVTVQDLRQAARLWGWSVKGSAKSDLISQVVEHLADPGEMRPAFQALPDNLRQAIVWLAHLKRADDQADGLQAALAVAEERNLAKPVIARIITELRQRLLLLVDPYQGSLIPDIYLEWLPLSAAPGLVFRGQATEILPAFSAEELDQHVEHLLTAVEAHPPLVTNGPTPVRSAPYPALPQQPAIGMSIQPHSGIVAPEVLVRWGYTTGDDQHFVRTLLCAALAGGLCRLKDDSNGKRLAVNAESLSNWRDWSPFQRQITTQYWWARGWQSSTPAAALSNITWDELDIVLSSPSEYTLRQVSEWLGREQLDAQIKILRTWLLALVQALQEDTWFSVHRLHELVYHLKRDLFLWPPYYTGWNWYADEARLDARQIPQRTWEETFGVVVEAWLTGPARWLGFVQVALDHGRPIAFMRPSTVQQAPTTTLPADMLRFLSDHTLALRNSWKTGAVRDIIGKIAIETARDRDATTYTLDTAAFRQTLRDGQTADQVAHSFAQAGFPLPEAVHQKLQSWQARVGQHQLYDNLAVIEFGDDITLAELQATIGLGRAELYPISARCLVVLQPDTVPALLDELRRKGYLPQVVS